MLVMYFKNMQYSNNVVSYVWWGLFILLSISFTLFGSAMVSDFLNMLQVIYFSASRYVMFAIWIVWSLPSILILPKLISRKFSLILILILLIIVGVSREYLPRYLSIVPKEYHCVKNLLSDVGHSRVSYIAKNNCSAENPKSFVMINENKSQQYDEVWNFTQGTNGNQINYSAKIGLGYFVIMGDKKFGPYSNMGEIAFSPDGKRFAAITGDYNNKEIKIVIDGIEQRKSYDWASEPIISADGKHIAYFTREQTKYVIGKHTVVIDGNESDQFDKVGTEPLGRWGIFSPDGNKFAYSYINYITPNEPSGYLIIKDFVTNKNIIYGPYSGSIYAMEFSPNNEHVAYIVSGKTGWMVIIDGVEGKKYKGTGNLTWAPDSNKIAYRAYSEKLNAKCERSYDRTCAWESFVVVEGKEIGPYDFTPAFGFEGDPIIFSHNSKIAAYRVAINKKWFAVIGDKKFEHDQVANNFVFSHDDQKVAYIISIFSSDYNEDKYIEYIEEGRELELTKLVKTAVINVDVINGQIRAGKLYDRIIGDPVFNDNGKHLAYMAGRNWGDNTQLNFVVIDEKIDYLFNFVSDLKFTVNDSGDKNFEYAAMANKMSGSKIWNRTISINN